MLNGCLCGWPVLWLGFPFCSSLGSLINWKDLAGVSETISYSLKQVERAVHVVHDQTCCASTMLSQFLFVVQQLSIQTSVRPLLVGATNKSSVVESPIIMWSVDCFHGYASHHPHCCHFSTLQFFWGNSEQTSVSSRSSSFTTTSIHGVSTVVQLNWVQKVTRRT